MHIFPDTAHSHSEKRHIALGETSAGRKVFVAFTLRERGGKAYIRPISARHMHPKEVEHYEKAITGTKY